MRQPTNAIILNSKPMATFQIFTGTIFLTKRLLPQRKLMRVT